MSMRGLQFIVASTARWAWFFAVLMFAWAALNLPLVVRIGRATAGFSIRQRLLAFMFVLPTIGLSFVQGALAVAFARRARGFTLGRRTGLAPTTRAFRQLWTVFFMACLLTLAGLALAALGLARGVSNLS